MGCAPSSCASFSTVGTEIVPHKLKPGKTKNVEAKTQKLKGHSAKTKHSGIKSKKFTGNSAKSRGKSSKKNKHKVPKSSSVFYGNLDNNCQDTSCGLETSHWNDHADWETRELEIRDCDADSDVTLQDSDAESDTTLEGEYGEEDDHLIGTGKINSKWTVTVPINQRTHSGSVIPSVEVNQRESFGRGRGSKKRSNLKRRTQKTKGLHETDTGIQNPAYAWVGDSATAYKNTQGQGNSQGQSQGQSQGEGHHTNSGHERKALKSAKSVKDSRSEKDLKLRTNFIPVRSTGDEEEDTWHSLCDSTTALDAESRSVNKNTEFLCDVISVTSFL